MSQTPKQDYAIYWILGGVFAFVFLVTLAGFAIFFSRTEADPFVADDQPNFQDNGRRAANPVVIPARMNAGMFQADSRLDQTDAIDPMGPAPCKVYSVPLVANRLVVIDLEGRNFDAYLRLEDPDGIEVAQNDDGGDGLNARIRYVPTKTGNFRVFATACGGLRNDVGHYRLTIREGGIEQNFPNDPFPPVANALPPKVIQASLKDGFFQADSQLDVTDGIDPRRRVLSKIYVIPMIANRSYQIDMVSRNFDTFLGLEDPNGAHVASDDDSGGALNARIVYVAKVSGNHRVFAQPCGGGLGPFVLTVREGGPGQAPQANFPNDLLPPKLGKVIRPPQEIQASLKDGVLLAESHLNVADGTDMQTRGYCKIFSVTLVANRTYVIDLVSKEFNAFLRLDDPPGQTVAFNDDGGAGTNARIRFTTNGTGIYRVFAIARGEGTGRFSLTIRDAANEPQMKEPEGPDIAKVPKEIQASLKDGVFRVDSHLDNMDGVDLKRKTHCKIYVIPLAADRSVQIDLVSRDFDSYLRLIDPAGLQVASNDDGGEGLNARIVYTPKKSGNYRVYVQPCAGGIGRFELTIREGGAGQALKKDPNIPRPPEVVKVAENS